MNPLSGHRLLRNWLIGIVVGVLSALLVFDLGGWRAFLLSVIGTLLVHALIALFLFGMLVFVTSIAQGFTGIRVASRGGLRIIFLVAVIAGLPLLKTVLHRALDVYDFCQVPVLVIAFECLFNPLSYIIRKQFRPPSPGRIAYAPNRLAPRTPVERELYGRLLSRVLGNRETADSLIAYEQSRAPRARLAELIERALTSWEKDNR
jgi:hypothetical protein